jgi:hypothetical protein
LLHKYTKFEVVFGLTASLVLMLAFSFCAYYLIHNYDQIEERQPYSRLAMIWFSIMMATGGLSGLIRIAAIKTPALNPLSAFLWTVMVLMFGLFFILAAVFGGDSISGGIPFMPRYINKCLGIGIFSAFGLVIVFLAPKIYRHKRDNG